MVRYLLKRLGRGILTILLSVTLVFFIVRAMPSNPVDLMVSPQMSEQRSRCASIEEFCLDQSKLTQLRPLYEGIASWQSGEARLCQANSGFPDIAEKRLGRCCFWRQSC